MSHYVLRSVNPDGRVVNERGTQAASSVEALSRAQGLAWDIASLESGAGDHMGWSVDVVDESDRLVLSIPVYRDADRHRILS